MEKQPHCPIGVIVVTPAAFQRLSPADMQYAVGEHAWGNWGLLEADQWKQNEAALVQGAPVFSLWSFGNELFWVVTFPGTIPGDTRTVTVISLLGEFEGAHALEETLRRRSTGETKGDPRKATEV